MLSGADHVMILSPSLTTRVHPIPDDSMVANAPSEPDHDQTHPFFVRLLLDGVFGSLKDWLSPFQTEALIAIP